MKVRRNVANKFPADVQCTRIITYVMHSLTNMIRLTQLGNCYVCIDLTEAIVTL